MLLLLYCLNYCLRFDRGVAHVVVILSTIIVKEYTQEWFILLRLAKLSTIVL